MRKRRGIFQAIALSFVLVFALSGISAAEDEREALAKVSERVGILVETEFAAQDFVAPFGGRNDAGIAQQVLAAFSVLPEIYTNYSKALENGAALIHANSVAANEKNPESPVVFSTLTNLGIFTNTLKSQDIKELLDTNSLDSILVVSFVVKPVRRTSNNRYWDELCIIAKFSVVTMHHSYLERSYELTSLQKPNMWTGRVNPKPLNELQSDLQTIALGGDTAAHNINGALAVYNSFGKEQSFYWDFYGMAGFGAPSKEMSSVIENAYNGTSEVISGLNSPGHGSLSYGAGTSMGFFINRSFVLGIGLDYNSIIDVGSETAFSDGNVNMTEKYSTLNIFPVIGIRFKPDNNKTIHTLTFEPGISFVNYNYTYTFGTYNNAIDTSGLGCSLNLRWGVRFSAAQGGYCPGQAVSGLGVGLVAGIVYAPKLTTADGKTLYYASDGNYYTSGGSILPNSKQAEFLSLNIGMYISYGFSL